MKAIAIADLHLNVNNRIEDTIKVLKEVALYAVSNTIDEVYIIGDIYQTKRPHNTERKIFLKFINYLTNANIHVIILAGNHDTDKENVSAVTEFDILNVPHVTMVPNPSVVSLGQYDIYLGHFLVDGAKLGPSDYTAETPHTIKEILKIKADLYCLGDVHKAQVLHTKPDILYTGSLERIDFGERDEEKSFVLITASNAVLSWERILLNPRPMIQYDVNSIDNLLVNVKNDIKNAIVKVKVKCTEEEYRLLDEVKIKEAYKDASNLTIEYEIQKEQRSRNEDITSSCSTLDAFKNYAKFKELDKETVSLGLELINQGE